MLAWLEVRCSYLPCGLLGTTTVVPKRYLKKDCWCLLKFLMYCGTLDMFSEELSVFQIKQNMLCLQKLHRLEKYDGQFGGVKTSELHRRWGYDLQLHSMFQDNLVYTEKKQAFPLWKTLLRKIPSRIWEESKIRKYIKNVFLHEDEVQRFFFCVCAPHLCVQGLLCIKDKPLWF